MDFRVIIPVRLNSQRLPGKALLEIAGKPMLQHVYQRAVQSGAISVVIATDSQQIRQVAENFGAAVCMTSSSHRSGTERLSEAILALGYEDNELVVNIQGDDPLIPPAAIHQVAQDLALHANSKVATLCEPIEQIEELFDSNVVKVVMNSQGYALYFSRAPIPWNRDQFQLPLNKIKDKLQNEHFRHIGLYAYRAGYVHEYLTLEPCPQETTEYLEQLRVLWHGGLIHVAVAKVKVPHGIDTEQDLARVRALMVN